MTHYDIRIEFTESDSDKSWECTRDLGLPVQSMEIAKENLRRIKAHAKYYNQINGWSLTPKEPERPDFCLDHENGIILKIDDERTHTILFPFWIGAMEHPKHARIFEIKPDIQEEDEMEFDFTSCY